MTPGPRCPVAHRTDLDRPQLAFDHDDEQENERRQRQHRGPGPRTVGRIHVQQRAPHPIDRPRRIQNVSPRHAKDVVDHLGHAAQDEEDGEADRAGHDSPLHVGGTGHRDQTENEQPQKEAYQHAGTKRPVREEPPAASQADLQREQEEARNPRDDRQHADDHRQPREGVAPAREGPAEVQRERVIRQVRRNQTGPGQRREEDRAAPLDVHENREEPAVNLDELKKPPVEALEQLHMICQIDEAGTQERPHERRHRQQENEPLLIELAPGVARKDHEARPPPRERSRVSPISAFVNCHVTFGWRRAPRHLACAPGGPWLSGRSLPACHGGA